MSKRGDKMARVTVRLYGEIAKKAGTTRYYMQADTVKDVLEQVQEKLPFIKKR
jgi:molybdopterin converting factor small subunit